MSGHQPRIALVGAPSVGKHDLAREIVSQWPKEGLGAPPWVFSGTKDSLTVAGLPLGEESTWRASLVLYGRLLEARDSSFGDEEASIEIGTGLAWMAHCGARMTSLSDRLLDLTVMEMHELTQARQSIPCLAISLIETWMYDYAFYMPTGEHSTDFEKGIDTAIQDIITSYDDAGTPFDLLRLEGGSSDAAGTVLNVLREMEPGRLQRIREVEAAEQDVKTDEATDDAGLDGPDDKTAEGAD